MAMIAATLVPTVMSIAEETTRSSATTALFLMLPPLHAYVFIVDVRTLNSESAVSVAPASSVPKTVELTTLTLPAPLIDPYRYTLVDAVKFETTTELPVPICMYGCNENEVVEH